MIDVLIMTRMIHLTGKDLIDVEEYRIWFCIEILFSLLFLREN
jgi:hypothetical protein